MARTRTIFRVIVLAALATFALALSGCVPGNGRSLDGTSWRVVSWSDDSIDPAEFTITAEFEDGRIGGTAAVNSYGGEYRTGPGNRFSVGQIAQTLMAGPEPAMEAESTYFELLGDAASYRLDNTTLMLFDADGVESLLFEALAE